MTRWITPLLLAALAGCLPESVDVVVLTPETPEIEQALRAADAQWEAAGVDPGRIRIGPGGATVRLVPERGPVSETRTTYRGTAFAGVKWMELNSLAPAMVAHEMGHALGIEFHRDQIDAQGVADCEQDAQDRPLMCSHVSERPITEWDLSAACDVGDCDHFTPGL